MELDFDDALVWGLQGYVRRVTVELGLTGESSCVQAEPTATLYLALDGRLRGFPDRDVALVWDEECGWSVAVETHSGEDLIIVAYFGADLLPTPQAVARWVRRLLRGERGAVGQPAVARWTRDDLVRRLVPYTAAELVPMPRSA
ncbi:DUF6292 family protein [Saccharothrix hoggarensis]|uniref:DUF6292 family protein n=1 Tax=Saccharothrix hoggarensis TaxID=913853 RepID=A0ABW3QZR8_9PSEU